MHNSVISISRQRVQLQVKAYLYRKKCIIYSVFVLLKCVRACVYILYTVELPHNSNHNLICINIRKRTFKLIVIHEKYLKILISWNYTDSLVHSHSMTSVKSCLVSKVVIVTYKSSVDIHKVSSFYFSEKLWK